MLPAAWQPMKDDGYMATQIKPNGVDLAKVRFTSSDIFALLNGMDAGLLACPCEAVPYSNELGFPLEDYKQALIHRYEQLGIVDSSGTPCDLLARALYPLNKPGVVVTNGKVMDPEDPYAKRRTFSVVVYEGCASAIVRAGGFRGGWLVVPFGPESQWEETFSHLLNLRKPFCPARFNAAAMCEVGRLKQANNAITSGEKDFARACANAIGIPADLFGDAADAFSSHRAPVTKRLSVVDYRDSAFQTIAGCTVTVPEQEDYRAREAFMVPDCGMVYSITVTGEPDDSGDPERAGKHKAYGRFDFISDGRLLNRLCQVDEYPDRFGAVSVQ